MAEPLKCVVEDDEEICVNEDLHISFRRTIRVPDNQQTSFLPPNLGGFPLKAISQYVDKLPGDMVTKGGLFFPMYRESCDDPIDHMLSLF
jgi:hypothetical protein